MKVRFLKQLATQTATFHRGGIYDLPEGPAARYMLAGLAEEVETQSGTPAKGEQAPIDRELDSFELETATKRQPETASRRRKG